MSTRIRKSIQRLYNTIYLQRKKVNYSTFDINGYIYIINKGSIEIGKNFKVNSGKHYNAIGGDTVCRFIVKKGAKLKIGDNVGISNSTIVCWDQVIFGNNIMIGGGCKIWDTNFHSLNTDLRISGKTKISDVKTAPIIINDNVFIGGSSIILKGSVIGTNSVIAAGSVVAGIIPDNEIWGGNPARLIRKL